MLGPLLGLTLCLGGSFFKVNFEKSLSVAMGKARGWMFVVSLYLGRAQEAEVMLWHIPSASLYHWRHRPSAHRSSQ